jgi:hypothetical protein
VTVTAGASVGGEVRGTVVVAVVVGGGVDVVSATVVGAPVAFACTFGAACEVELPHAAAKSTSATAAIGAEPVIRLLIVTASVAPERLTLRLGRR